MKIKFKRDREFNILFAITCIFLSLSVLTVRMSGRLFPDSEEMIQSIHQETASKNTIPGNIYDRNGVLLCELCFLNEKDISSDGIEQQKVYQYPDEYAPLLGYIHENGNGLWGSLSSIYRDVLYNHTEEASDRIKGNHIYLTLDHQLQTKVYEIVTRMMENLSAKEHDEEAYQQIASAVVMDAETGEVLAMVSLPTYDPENVVTEDEVDPFDETKKEVTKIVERPITYRDCMAPGSTFKLMTSILLLEDQGGEQRTFLDNNIQDLYINNNYGSLDDSINYVLGIRRSSNVFFANAAMSVCQNNNTQKFTELVKRIGIGEELKLDFGDVSSEWRLNDESVMNSLNAHETTRKIADTGYGQGDVKLSTINNAMIVSAIINEGVAVSPYMIKSITDYDGNPYSRDEAAQKFNTPRLKTENQKKYQLTTPEVANKIYQAMIDASKSYTYEQDFAKARSGGGINWFARHNLQTDTGGDFINESNLIAAKSGTAEVVCANGEGLYHNIWFSTCSKTGGHKYAVVLNMTADGDGSEYVRYGSQLSPYAEEIYDILENYERDRQA